MLLLQEMGFTGDNAPIETYQGPECIYPFEWDDDGRSGSRHRHHHHSMDLYRNRKMLAIVFLVLIIIALVISNFLIFSRYITVRKMRRQNFDESTMWTTA